MMDPTAVHGVTQFSDLTEEEFQRMYTGVVDVGGGRDGSVGAEAPVVEVEGLPKDFDWREKGGVTEVKNQVCSLYLRFDIFTKKNNKSTIDLYIHDLICQGGFDYIFDCNIQKI